MENVLLKLSKVRYIFHSEADFQHSFALQLLKISKYKNIRLERPVRIDKNKSISVDIFLKYQEKWVGIECKYWTKKLEWFDKNLDEGFDLTDQGASDRRCYGYWKDVERLEKIKESKIIANGYAICLTNYPVYWERVGEGTISELFRITEGRKVNNKILSWLKKPSAGSIKSIEDNIEIKGNYKITWKNYSDVSGVKFKYSILKV